MGIRKINSIDEIEKGINLLVRSDIMRVCLDISITPIYCCNCKTQVDGLFVLEGSRYGQVGVIACNCGASISCVDSDNFVEYLETYTDFNDERIGEYYIDFRKLYLLDDEIWLKFSSKINYNIFEKYTGQTIQLETIIKDISPRLDIEYLQKTHRFERPFLELPEIIFKWKYLVEKVEEL